jgi:hypothetical protein
MVKGKVVLVLNGILHHEYVSVLNKTPRHEDVWGNGVTAPRILNFGTRWSGQFYDPAALPPGTELPVLTR